MGSPSAPDFCAAWRRLTPVGRSSRRTPRRDLRCQMIDCGGVKGSALGPVGGAPSPCGRATLQCWNRADDGRDLVAIVEQARSRRIHAGTLREDRTPDAGATWCGCRELGHVAAAAGKRAEHGLAAADL